MSKFTGNREKRIRVVWIGLAILLSVLTASAQLQVGDDVNLNLSGNLGFGYTDTFGNYNVSSHSQGVAGDAILTGYYFHPNFVSFDFRPYVDRTQSNSESQNSTRSTGFGGSVNFFGGSRFPGSVNYAKDFSHDSQLNIAGLPAVIGDSSSRNFGISWAALLPNWPQLRLTYGDSSNGSSIDGLSEDTSSSSRNLLLNSTYSIAGFNLQGNINHFSNHYSTSDVLLPIAVEGGGSSTNYAITGQHRLPWHGSLGLGWGHSSYASDNGSDWSTSYYSENVLVSPRQWLSLSQNLNYTTNLSASLIQNLGAIGTTPELLSFGTNSDSLYLSHTATFHVVKGLSLNGHFNHREQDIQGQHYSDSQFGGSVNYNFNHPLFGFLYFGGGVIDTASQEGHEGLGFFATVGMNRKVGKWETAADFNYQHDVQTLVATINTSNYSYGGSIHRRVNRETFVGMSARDSRSLFTAVDGNGSNAQSFSGSLGWRRYSLTGSYSQSSGTAVLNTNGSLTPVPVGPLITPEFLLFNGRSYAVTGSAIVLRRIVATASYANYYSDTAQGSLFNVNKGQQYNARMEYKLRKFSIVAGFGRNNQSLSSLAGPPREVNTFYFSLTRWFTFF